jgi:hypothetical protein
LEWNASSSGAGIYLNAGIHSITDSIIRNNPKTGSATQGGGIYFLSSSGPSTITNTIIKDNPAVSGGGITFNSGTANFYKCTITGNISTTGGAVYAYGTTTANFENCVIAGNQAGKAGVVYVNNSSANMSFVNTTFADNQATSSTGGVFDVCAVGSLTVRNSIFWNNTASGLGDNCYKECGGSDGYMTITDSI